MRTTEETKTAIERPLVGAVFGAAFLWAWGFLCYLSPVMFPPHAGTQNSIGIEIGFFVSQATVVLFVLAILVFSRFRPVVLGGAGLFFAALGLSVTSAALSVFLNVGFLPGVIFCGMLDGVCAACLTIAWGARYSLGAKSVRLLVLLSFLIAYCLYLTVPLLPSAVGVVVVSLLPMASWLLWSADAAARNEIAAYPFDGGHGPEESISEIMAGAWEASGLPWKSLSVLVVAGFVGNLIASVTMGSAYDGAQSLFQGGALVCSCIAVMALAVVSADNDTLKVSALYRITVTFSALGMVLILVFGAAAVPVGGAFVQGGAMFLQALIILAVTQSTQEQGLSPVFSFGVGQAVVSGVVLLGNVLGKAVVVWWNGATWLAIDADALSVVCGAGILVLFFMLVARNDDVRGNLLENESNQGECRSGQSCIEAMRQNAAREMQPESECAAEAFQQHKISRFADEFSLTKRETEVFTYLAHGRSLPYIAEELFITTGTVKTHTMHIYRKLGVGSKQELMDALEVFE